MPIKGVGDYAGTKPALAGYARGSARDLGSRNITSNVLQPGALPTDMSKEGAGESPDLETFLDMHPIRRFATLEEVSGAVCFAGSHAGSLPVRL